MSPLSVMKLFPTKKEYWNKCTVCGKFIAFKDFESGEATSELVLPESEFTKETYEIICKRCKQKGESHV